MKSKRVINQTTEILRHLKKFKSITQKQATDLYGATRLSAIIYNFRKRGYLIDTVMLDGVTRYGTPCQYGKYVYKGQEEK